jgi:hypothetical protein
MLAEAGETETATDAGMEGGTATFEAVPQEASAMAARKTNRNKKMRRKAADIVRLVSGRGREKGNWTEVQKWGMGGGRES